MTMVRTAYAKILRDDIPAALLLLLLQAANQTSISAVYSWSTVTGWVWPHVGVSLWRHGPDVDVDWPNVVVVRTMRR